MIGNIRKNIIVCSSMIFLIGCLSGCAGNAKVSDKTDEYATGSITDSYADGKSEGVDEQLSDSTKDSDAETGMKENTDRSKFYLPEENSDIDYKNPNSKWSFARCTETEHFYIFWEKDFGENPNSDNVPENMRVDVQALADMAEECYDTNVNDLQMVDPDFAEKYKLQIYLLYNTDWVATGSGYDNTIGALWVSPMTCKPAGSVIAHEIGHCFQYLVYAEKIANGQEDDSTEGFRYSYGEGQGNAFWELCAQWQSWQDYPAEMFTDYEMDVWFENYNQALESEYTRYQNYWWFYYLTEKYGRDAPGRIWKESIYPEDAYTCFRRLYLETDTAENTDGSLDAFYDELYEYASKAVTFDFEAADDYSEDWQGRYDTVLYECGEENSGFRQVAYADCPEANGFATVKIDFPESATSVSLDFKGLQPGSVLAEADSGEYVASDLYDETETTEVTSTYNAYDGTPGWHYGFVALSSFGERTYGECYTESSNTVTFDIPQNTAYLYFVVVGTPENYEYHIWDQDESTDVQMPFAIRVTYKQ